jgi:hypothetical protein
VRVQQYKDELLAAVIELVLAVPKQFVQVHAMNVLFFFVDVLHALQVGLLVPALQTAFRMGLRFIPLACVGLDALEHWLEVLPMSAIQPHLKQILPCLTDYMSKEWVELREKALLADLADTSTTNQKKNRAELIEKVLSKEQGNKVLDCHYAIFV